MNAFPSDISPCSVPSLLSYLVALAATRSSVLMGSYCFIATKFFLESCNIRENWDDADPASWGTSPQYRVWICVTIFKFRSNFFCLK